MTSAISGVLAATLLVLLSCGKDTDADQTEYSIVGTWSYNCLEFSSSGTTELRSESYTFGASTMERSYRAYDSSDTSCQNPIQVMSIEATYLSKDSDSGHKTLDLDISQVTVKFSEAETIKFLNAEAGTTNSTAQCGGGFVVDTEKSLTKADCESANSFGLPYSNMTLYNIYSTTGGILALGNKTGLVTEESERATELETAASLARQ